jgi:hypothetical protein
MLSKRAALVLVKLCFCAVAAGVVYAEPPAVFARGSLTSPEVVSCPKGCFLLGDVCAC